MNGEEEMSLRSQIVGALLVCSMVAVTGPVALAEEPAPPHHAMHHHHHNRHPGSRFRHHHRGPAHEFGKAHHEY